MTSTSSKRPSTLSATSAAVLDVLSGLTMFPWPLLKTQAERRGLEPAALMPADVAVIIDDVVVALERFTSPQKAQVAREGLEKLKP